jgi:hypothetical protein
MRGKSSTWHKRFSNDENLTMSGKRSFTNQKQLQASKDAPACPPVRISEYSQAIELTSISVGSQGPRKNSGSHIDASHSRQPLVKGERLVRYEVNAVMLSFCLCKRLAKMESVSWSGTGW